jgi:hypothetical protein
MTEILNGIEREWHLTMVSIYEVAKREVYDAKYFIQMLSERGGKATALHLLGDNRPAEGFTTLWLHGRLELTVEAHVLLPEFASLFTDADRARALDRLQQYGWPGQRQQCHCRSCVKRRPELEHDWREHPCIRHATGMIGVTWSTLLLASRRGLSA